MPILLSSSRDDLQKNNVGLRTTLIIAEPAAGYKPADVSVKLRFTDINFRDGAGRVVFLM
jgi:hypothetical protein